MDKNTMSAKDGRRDMWDLLMLGISVVFFVVALLYVTACERLR
jgi:hypothetical protein